MFKVITLDQFDIWDEIVNGFSDVDVYHLSGYLQPLDNYINSQTTLFYYTNIMGKVALIMSINDIANSAIFANILPANTYFDMETPYGYGGALVEGYSESLMQEFYLALNNFAKSKGIISQFIRFNPMTNNCELMKNICKTTKQKHTIFIDLESPQLIDANMDSKNRNMVRKAQKNNIEIKIMDANDYDFVTTEFKSMYKITMQRNNAEEFYYFDKTYFDSFFNNFKNNYKLFYATYDNKIISMAIIMMQNSYIHYHLSAADRDYMHLAPNNLLLYQVAMWGNKNGYKKFHLGGGVCENDRLFSFKKAFNKTSVLDFSIGCNIFDEQKFNQLVELRKEMDEKFDLEKKFMIKYRQ